LNLIQLKRQKVVSGIKSKKRQVLLKVNSNRNKAYQANSAAAVAQAALKNMLKKVIF
jgi:hypothetical protein